MENGKKKMTFGKKLLLICIAAIVIFNLICCGNSIGDYINAKYNSFHLLSSPDNKDFENELYAFAEENDINLYVDYQDDLEAIDTLNGDTLYDAVWMSNSVWLYMLENNTTTSSKSININPVVFGIKKSKAQELGFVDTDVYNKDIVNAIKNGKLKYIMSSVTKTNTGMISYLGFLNALAGSPEILTSKMVNDKKLIDNLTTLFSGVERVSGSDDFLHQMFINSDDYEAVIATESSLININKELLAMPEKEELYLIYPVDGVAINDSPFAYLDHKQGKEEEFLLLQSFLLSKETQTKLERMGKRTWYGGTNLNADKDSFRKDWGIDTSEYLIPLKYPSKQVMDEALINYINYIRKPSSVAFCLDYSGSMYGDGINQLRSAMNLILTYEEAAKEKIQFSDRDKIYILPFSNEVDGIFSTTNGKETNDLLYQINVNSPYGGTNIYGCSIKALELLNKDSNDYTKTVILMTDGESNVGTFSNLESYYNESQNIPIYSIMFGSSSERELREIADLTNAKVFDGRRNLIAAFKEVRSYN